MTGQHQRARLLTSVKPHEHPIMMETLTHLERRISALMYFIQPLRQRYDRFHGDPCPYIPAPALTTAI